MNRVVYLINWPLSVYDKVNVVQSIKCIYKALLTSADVTKCCTETQPQMFIDDQQGQIIIITVVVEGAASQHFRSKCQLALHRLSFRVRDSRCGRERELKTAGLVERERVENSRSGTR